MSQVLFTNTAGPAYLYIAQSTTADTGWCAFVLPAAAPAQQEQLTLAEIWALQKSGVFGSFIFTLQAPSDTAAFAGRVNDWQAQYTPQGHSFLWLQAPDAPVSAANSSALITGSNKFYRIVSQDFNVPFGNFATFSATRNVIIGLNDDASAICLTYYNYFSLVSFAPGISPGSSDVDFQSFLSFSGATRGCFTFGMRLQDQQVLTGYGAAFRYFYGNGENSYYELGAPIFTGTAATPGIYLSCCADPLDAFNMVKVNGQTQCRTYLSFTAPGDENPLPQLATGLRCDTGETVVLAPVVSFDNVTGQPTAYCARLVLQPRAAGNPLMPAYFVPAGDFTMVILDAPLTGDQGNPRVFQLLPGLSGLETITFFPARTGYAGDVLRFTPGAPAYSPGYPFPEVSLTAGGTPPVPLLTGDWGTVGVNILSATVAPQYSAQAADAPLYATGQPQTGADPSFLGYFEPSASVSQQPGFSFAASAYGGLTAIPAGFQQFESQILNPARKAAIRGAATQTYQSKLIPLGLAKTNPDGVWATTHHGLLVNIGKSGGWNELQLGQNTVDNTFYQLRFLNLTDQLQAAFQSNQLMLVATQNRYLGAFTDTPPPADGKPYFQNELSIDEWTFRFNTGVNNTFSDKRNVLIFKFCDGTLKDRVKNPGKWEQAEGFNIADPGNPLPNELTAVSQWLQDYMSDAETQYAAGNQLFAKFVSVINDASWNGILILKADLNLEEFPQEIRGMLAGMNLSQLNGHHIGIEVSRIMNGASLAMENNSSIFGLINYLDPAYLQMQRNAGGQDLSNVPVSPPFGVDYDFKVLSLQVLFENTRIKSFRSKVQLTLNKLFADKVVRMITPASGATQLNSVVLNGTYQRHNDMPVYIFDQNGLNHFQLAGNVLTRVSVLKVQFNTLENPDGSMNTVQSRFTIWGTLSFDALQGMDLFSFGGPPDDQVATGLYFSNLFVNMQFDMDAPAARTFSFRADQTAFNATADPPRPGSLYPSFALETAGLIQPDTDAKPASLGYLAVQAQGLSLTGMQSEWFGLNMKINLGSPGALASGVFSTSLLLAWSPGGQGTVYPAWVGIRLPGAASNAKMLSIQGVLKLTVGSIQLMYVPTAAGENAFLLQMNRIALSFLGLIKFPPGGNTSFFLFGNPAPGATTKSLGWYAAWVKDPPKQAKALPDPQTNLPA